MPPLSCEEIRCAVQHYNTSEYTQEAAALKRALVQPNSMLGKVCLVADWGSIQGFAYQSRVHHADVIEQCWTSIQHLQRLDEGDWLENDGVMRKSLQALRVTPLLCRSHGRAELSFVSKFLHWCVSDAFPMWDNNARKALERKDFDYTWDEYEQWTKIIGEQIRQHRACLSQGSTDGESMVRTLDKALWWMGRKL